MSMRELVDLCSRSANNNHRLGITGILCYRSESFLQVLEGTYQAVNRVFRAILLDKRHREVTLIAYREIAVRLFEGWDMKLVIPEKLEVRPELLAECEQSEFAPFPVDEMTAFELLYGLKRTVAA